jgi:hypothetical protein
VNGSQLARQAKLETLAARARRIALNMPSADQLLSGLSINTFIGWPLQTSAS